MHDNSILLTYLPHGSNPKSFYPIDESSPDWTEFSKFRSEFDSKNNSPEFSILFNNRNIRRKSPGDVLLSYKRFCDGLSKQDAAKCCLIMKTSVIDDNGTDLLAVKKVVCPKYRVLFIPDLMSTQQMNWLYNVCDVVLFLSSAEGFGLAANEGMLAGRMLVAPVTGGLQDQMRFEDSYGRWIQFSDQFTTNHRGAYRSAGPWCVPLFPTSRVLNGSPATPYIFDDYVDAETAAQALRSIYDMPKELRREMGLSGRDWAMSKESGMSSPEMCNHFIESINALLQTWVPPAKKWEMVTVGERPIADNIGVQWWGENLKAD